MIEANEMEMIRELDRLRIRHRKLDREIFAITKQNPNDQFTLYKLKKEKLSLRDQIISLEKVIYPDIIA